LLALLLWGCDSDPKVARQKYVDTGNRYFNTGKFRQAEIFYQRSLQKDPRFGEAYYRISLTQLKLGKIRDAMRNLQRAVELQPQNTDAATKLAELYLTAYAGSEQKPKQLLKEIEDISKKLLDRNPNSFEGLRLKGFLQLTNNDRKGALESFLAADRVKPLQRELATVIYQTYLQNEMPAEAIAYAERMMAKDKEYEPMYDVVYANYAVKEDIANGEAILLKKLAALPKQPNVRVQLAAHYFASKQFDKVKSTLGEILKMSGDGIRPRMIVGDFYFKIRDFD
jgi:tetratricopeptide (TPR) repeat protein